MCWLFRSVAEDSLTKSAWPSIRQRAKTTFHSTRQLHQEQIHQVNEEEVSSLQKVLLRHTKKLSSTPVLCALVGNIFKLCICSFFFAVVWLWRFSSLTCFFFFFSCARPTCSVYGWKWLFWQFDQAASDFAVRLHASFVLCTVALAGGYKQVSQVGRWYWCHEP